MIEIPNGTFIGDDARGPGVYMMTVDRPLTQAAKEALRVEWAKTFRGNGAIVVLELSTKLHRAGDPGNDGLVPGAEFCAA